MNYRQLICIAEDELKRERNGNFRGDSFYLFEDVFGMNKGEFYKRAEDEVEEPDLVPKYLAFIEKRKRNVPLQQITGTAYFMGDKFKVTKDTLIPRFDTELIIELVSKEIKEPEKKTVLDLCCGSGCILVSLMKNVGFMYGLGTDISDKALIIAEENKKELLKERSQSVDFKKSDMFETIEKRDFDIIVSNPPYIKESDIDKLDDEVKCYEPISALTGGPDGLSFYRIISSEAGNYLIKGGKLFVEIGYDQADDVTNILEKDGWKEIRRYKDLSGHDRVITAAFV